MASEKIQPGLQERSGLIDLIHRVRLRRTQLGHHAAYGYSLLRGDGNLMKIRKKGVPNVVSILENRRIFMKRSAGIDIGSRTIKLVLVENGDVVLQKKTPST
ncbi:MAG: hypothetical protein D3904_17740 [Candidatus Electrothrix sp. EH2]|nr:hypothetical protein [Candidatus Electrothrix sp. EH2]